MGEAKWRKSNDPLFGKPKRGLIISPPMEIEGGSIKLRSSQLDPQELRYALLFWDKLVWPTNNAIHITSDSDASFLERSNILSRPSFTSFGRGSDIVIRSYVQAWRELETKEPGAWALAQGENSLLLRDQVIEEGNGTSFSLFRAIPVPDKTVPLAEILEFKRKRADELFALRGIIDGMLAEVANAESPGDELRKQISKLDSQCADVLKVTREWPFPVRLSDIRVSLDLKPTTALTAIMASYADPIGIPIVSALLGGAAASIKVTGDFGLARRAKRVGPYRYIYSFNKELFV